MKIINTTYKIGSKLNKTILLISDIHYYNKHNITLLNKVIDKIKKIMPDYICITGDLIDQSNILDSDILIEWLIKLGQISKVLYSIGNHEFYISEKSKKYKLNTKLLNKINNIENVCLLNNENKIIDNINFMGLTLPIEYYEILKEHPNNFNKYLDKFIVDKKYFNVLLCHSPINIYNNRNLNININLVLCGHMHGGGIPNYFRKFVKNVGIISPKRQLFPKYCYGKIKVNNTNIITSSGITVLSNMNKLKMFNFIFNPELVIIKI